MCGDFLAEAPSTLFQTAEAYVDSAEAAWSRQLKAVERKAPDNGSKLEEQLVRQWSKVSVEAARAGFCPVSVSVLAGDSPRVETDEAVEALPFKDREVRYGSLFGSAVHYAIALMLRSSGMTARDAVQRAAKLYGLAEHHDEAVADVERALQALRAGGLVRPSIITDLQLDIPSPAHGSMASSQADASI